MKIISVCIFFILAVAGTYGQQFHIENISHPIMVGHYNAIAQDIEGVFAANDDQIFLISGENIVEVPMDCPSFCDIRDMATDVDGVLYVASERGSGLFSLLPGTQDVLLNERVTAVAVGPEKTVYAGSASVIAEIGIGVYANDQWTFYTEANSVLTSNLVYDIKVTPDSIPWFATPQGLVKLEDGLLTVYTTPDLSETFYDLAVDAAGNVYCASGFGGIGVFDGTGWQTFPDIFSPLASVREVEVTSDGKIWVADDELIFIDGDEVHYVPYGDLNLGGGTIVRSMFMDQTDRLWVSLDFSNDLAIISEDMGSSVSGVDVLPDGVVFPNPARSSITVRNADAGTATHYVISNAGGIVEDAGPYVHGESIDVQALSGGLHILELWGSEKISIAKFIKK